MVEHGEKSRMLNIYRVIFSIGVGGGMLNVPKIPGMVRLFPARHC